MMMKIRGNMSPSRKKDYVEFPGVTDFMEQQPEGVRLEYNLIVERLEAEGRLSCRKGKRSPEKGCS